MNWTADSPMTAVRDPRGVWRDYDRLRLAQRRRCLASIAAIESVLSGLDAQAEDGAYEWLDPQDRYRPEGTP